MYICIALQQCWCDEFRRGGELQWDLSLWKEKYMQEVNRMDKYLKELRSAYFNGRRDGKYKKLEWSCERPENAQILG